MAVDSKRVFVLTQFIFRLSFGMALAMAITPARLVTSGYYRNHLYVLLGFNVLASLVAVASPEQFALWPPITAALLSYFGAVAWLYEKRRLGVVCLAALSGVCLIGSLLAGGVLDGTTTDRAIDLLILDWLDPISGGLVLGVTIAAMFLGHWYLNTPTMQLTPLQRLVVLMAVAIIARLLICGVSLGLEVRLAGAGNTQWWIFIAMRWSSGLLGALALAWMAWQTLKIPNTQSATGILYVGVIATFLGELAALLLSADSTYPL